MTDMIVGVLHLLKNFIVNVIPEVSIGASAIENAHAALTTIMEFLSVASFLVPFKTIFAIVGIVYGFRLVKFGVFIVNWVIRRIFDVIP